MHMHTFALEDWTYIRNLFRGTEPKFRLRAVAAEQCDRIAWLYVQYLDI